MTQTQTPGEQTRRLTTGTSLAFTWFPTVRTAPGHIRSAVAERLDADPRRVGLTKMLLDPRHPSVKLVNEVRASARDDWMMSTLPYVEDGTRLVRRETLPRLHECMRDYQHMLAVRAIALDRDRADLIDDARSRLGSMFSLADYPDSFIALLRLRFTVRELEPPSYLAETCPQIYGEQVKQTVEAFAAAAQTAERAFAGELLDMVLHLRERLEGHGPEDRRIFRDSAVTNLREFFNRFRTLDIESSSDLRLQIADLEAIIEGVDPATLRIDGSLRSNLRAELALAANALETLTVEAPRRRVTSLAPTPTPAAAS